jgi:hypothetical protein
MRRPLTAPLLSVLLLVATITTGCERPERPPDVGLSDSLFVSALVEAHLAAARAAHTGEDADSLRALGLAGIGLDTTTFTLALDAYARRPEVLRSAYDRAIDRLLYIQMEWAEALRPAVIPGDTIGRVPEGIPEPKPSPPRDLRERLDVF